MRVSMHSGRGSAKHNDHGFRSEHIDESKKKFNLTFTAVDTQEDEYTAEYGEEIFYKNFFGKTLEKQNEKCVKRGQYGRVRDMEAWMKTRQHEPTETIFQIGDMEEHPDVDVLIACIDEYSDWKQEKYKDNLRIVSCSIHVDEATPHAHLREVWFAHDEDGLPVPGIKKGLKEAGVPLPDPTKSESKDNYRKKVIDAECRTKWQEICKAHGLEIETEPKKRQVGHLGKEAYISMRQEEERLQGLETSLNDREASLNILRAEISAENERLSEIALKQAEKEKELKSREELEKELQTLKNGYKELEKVSKRVPGSKFEYEVQKRSSQVEVAMQRAAVMQQRPRDSENQYQ